MNNPISYYDPSGYAAISLVNGLIVSAVIGGLVSVCIAVWVGMAIGEGLGLLFCGEISFGGNILSQSISSYNSTSDITIKFGEAFFAGFINSLVCMATMRSMNLCMSDSFIPALTVNTFGSRFVEFMSFDGANTVA